MIDLRGKSAAWLCATLAALGLTAALAGCAPEVGSERWCEQMRDKPRGDWTGNEALEYGKSCIIN